MQIHELLQLTYWIERNIKQTSVAQSYQDLTNAIGQNVNARNNQPRQPFASQQERVLEIISQISTNDLTHAQENMLKTLHLYEHIGEWGARKLEDILYRNGLDIANAHSEVNNILQEVNSAVTRSDQLKSQLKPLIEADEDDYPDETRPEEVMIRVHFQNDVSLQNVSDLKKWSATWFDIGRGIALAHDCTPEDVRVVGAQKGSIIIELATIAAIVTTTSTIILSALKVAERVLAIRKQVEEIKGLKLANTKLTSDLEKEADKAKKEGLDTINVEMLAELKLKQDEDGEKINALKKSISKLVDFIENGGEVDFVTQEGSEDKEELERLRVNFKEIKELERKMLALENKKGVDQ